MLARRIVVSTDFGRVGPCCYAMRMLYFKVDSWWLGDAYTRNLDRYAMLDALLSTCIGDACVFAE